jgi:HEAT repeat protein
MRDLKHPEHRMRRDLIRHLFYSSDPRAPALLSRMSNGDPDSHVRFLARKALHLLERRAAVAPATGSRSVQERLRAPDARLRQAAVWELARLREPRSFELLAQMLPVEPDQFVRTAIARTLPRLGGEKAVPALQQLLADESNRVRAAAVEGLTEVGHLGSVREILVMLSDPDERVQSAASRALLAFGFDRVTHALHGLVKDADPQLREAAARVLHRLRIREMAELVSSLGKDADPVRAALDGQAPRAFSVARALGVLAQRPAEAAQEDPLESPHREERLEEVRDIVTRRLLSRIPKVGQRLEVETDAGVKATLVMALGMLKARDCEAQLMHCLKDPDDRVRANAVEALGMMEDPSVLKMLVPLLKDGAPRVRANAIIALKRMRGIDLSAPLKEMIEHGDARTKASAIYAITDLNASELSLLLKPLLASTDPELRMRALEGLEIMRRGGNLVAGALLAEQSTAGASMVEGLDFAPHEWDEPLE